jgi:hypothetical protein
MGDISVLMSERERVIEAVTALFVRTDMRDWAAVKSCFTGSVLFDMSSLGAGGPAVIPADRIVNGWAEGLKSLQAVHHQAGNFQVRITGDGAKVSCYGIAYHYLPNRTGRNTRMFVGSYDLHLVQQSGDWKIDAFRFNAKFVDGNPDLEKS